MKKRNIFFILSAIFVSLGALIGCNNNPEYVPYYSVVYKYGVDESGTPITIDGKIQCAEFVKPGELATKPSIHHETYGEPEAWCTDEACTTVFDFSTPINEKTKLWALWKNQEPTLIGVAFTTIAKQLLTETGIDAGTYIKITNDMWTPIPATAKYQNLKFTSADGTGKIIVQEISGEYYLYASQAGTATLTVSIDSTTIPAETFTDTINVKINANEDPVKTVLFTKPTSKSTTNIDMDEVKDYQTKWQVKTQSGKDVTSSTQVAFVSDNENVATVDSTGNVTFKAAGTVNITIAVQGAIYQGNPITDSVTFKVTKTVIKHATDFTLNATSVDLFYSDSIYTYNKEFQLVATFTPADADDKSIVCVSDNKNVTVDKTSGLIEVKASAPNDGSSLQSTITVTHHEEGQNDIVKQCIVNLILPVETISFTTSEKNLDPGATFVNELSLNTSTNKKVTDKTEVKGLEWKSSNNNVATVNSDGTVTAISSGEATIRATNTYEKLTDKPYAEFKVTVNQKLTDFYFDKTELTMVFKNSPITELPKTYQLQVTYVPSGAKDKDLEWSSSDTNVATVDSKGNITVKDTTDGIAKDVTITAKHATVGSRTCKIHVVMPVKSLSLDTTGTVNLYADTSKEHTHQAIATLNSGVAGIAPSSECSNLEWKSSDTSVATVDQNGLVTAVNGGDTTITVTNTYDKLTTKPSASYKVHVYHKIQKISLSAEYIFFADGYKTKENVTLTISPTACITDLDSIVWSAQDPSVVNISVATNKLSATITPGTTSGDTYIYVKAKDKYGTEIITQCGVTNYDKTPTPTKMSFEFNNDSYSAYSNESTWEHIVIPDTYDDGTHGSYNVKAIKDSGFEGMYVTDVYIPHTIETIGTSAFESCSYLSMVLFSIDKTNNSLVSIGANAFKPKSIGTKLEYVGLEYCNKLTTIGASAFENQIALPAITIPANVTSIGDKAFNNCQSLQSVTIESSTIAKLDNPGSLFTTLSAATKVVRVPKGTSVGNTLSTYYTKTTENNYDVYTQK